MRIVVKSWIVGVAAWASVVPCVNAALVVDQSNLVSEVEGGLIASSYSQTFTAGFHGLLSQIDVQIFKLTQGSSANWNTTTFELRSTTNGLIGGVLFSKQISIPAAAFFGPMPTTSIDVSSLGLVVDPGDVLAISFSGGPAYWASKSDYLPPVPPSNIAIPIGTYDRGSPFSANAPTSPESYHDLTFQTYIAPQTQQITLGQSPFTMLSDSSNPLIVDLPDNSAGEFSAYSGHASLSEIVNGAIPGLNTTDFIIPGSTFQYWNLDFTGSLAGGATVTFTYDESLLGGADESQLRIYHYENGEWIAQDGVVDPVSNTIMVHGITSLSPWGLFSATGGTEDVPEPASLIAWAALSLIGFTFSARQISLAKPVNAIT